eukprot:TRINITY_DN57226_c0_g1_i1.p1 TRINITY_DN57226_c0_g1~~TRINITY_DN57226_c0_g1_i1.p1  ORF type:complete len:720 (-),score=174.36 TRINITY_DN57226_c0_g1_i1:93-2252(-)
MHALPHKLAELREEILAGVQRRFVEQKLSAEQQLKESTQRAADEGFQRAYELLQPQLTSLSSRLEADTGEIREKQSLNFASCVEETNKLREQVEKQEKDLLSKVVGIRAELPTMNSRIKSLDESLGKLSLAPAEIRKELADSFAQISGGLDRLRSQVAEQARQALDSEAATKGREREAAQAVADRFEATEQLIRDARKQTSLLEESAQKQFTELSKRVEEAFAAAAIQGPPRSPTPGAMMDSPEPIAQGQPSQFGVDLADQSGILNARTQSLQLEVQTLRHELDGTVNKVNNALKEFFAIALQEVKEAQQSATTSFQEAATTEVQCLCESSRKALAEEAARLKAGYQIAQETATKHAAEAQEALNTSAKAAAQEARQLAAGEADRRLARALQLLKSERHADVQAHAREKEQTMEDMRLELKRTIKSCQQECEAAARQAVAGILPSDAIKPSQPSQWAELMSSAGQLAADTAEFRLQFAEAREAWDQGLASLRAEMQLYTTRAEAADAAVAAAATTSELNIKLTHVGAALDRQRNELERLGRWVVDVRERCESQDTSVKHLGSQLAISNAATSSLCQGVVTALQVLGLVREELGVELLPPRAPDGVTPYGFAHSGMQVEVLLQWEKAGQSLATRVEKNWSKRKAQSSRNMLELVERKAEDTDFHSWVNTLKGSLNVPAPPSGVATSLGYAPSGMSLAVTLPPPQTPRKLTPLSAPRQVLA